jgi:hypothetical protein
MKRAYISPPTGTLEITVVRDKEPYVTLTLDLGIPNFTVFSLKMPVVQARPVDMTALLAEALSALLDEMSAFMLSMDYHQDIIVRTYATILATFKEMTPESNTDTDSSAIGKDDTVVTYEGSFPLPQNFVNETYDKVVTGSHKVIQRMPKQRHIELTVVKPTKVDTQDVGKLIRQYRGRSIKTQPKPMYVVVYDMAGRPAGTVAIGPNFKNNLLKMQRRGGVAAPQYTDRAQFENETEMKFKNLVGIPKSVYLGGQAYLPEAFAGDDMALYRGPEKYLVKFPDGRCVKFTNRPSVQTLKSKNFPVPSTYWRWNLIKEEEPQESIEQGHDNPSGTNPDQSGDQPQQDVLGEARPI